MRINHKLILLNWFFVAHILIANNIDCIAIKTILMVIGIFGCFSVARHVFKLINETEVDKKPEKLVSYDKFKRKKKWGRLFGK